MPRRTFNRAEVYVGTPPGDGELVEASASVTYDSGKSKIDVKVGSSTTTYEQVVATSGPDTRGRDRVRTWTLADGRVVTAITAGCNCGR